MQTIYLDISNKGNVSTINAKQGDVGRKFRAIITENGTVPTTVDVETSEFSIWYSGASGNGNYKTIGDRSAFYQENNTVVVELIRQMLKVPGKGELSLSMECGGDRIGLWNIPYDVEAKPGADSETATDYFDDLANAQQKAEKAADRAEDAADRAEDAADRAEKAANDTLNAAESVADKKPQDLKVTATFDTIVNDTISTGTADVSAFEIATAISKGATVTLIDDDNRVYKYCGYRLEPNYSNAFFEAQEIDANGITTYTANINNEGQASRTKYTHEYATANTDPDRHAEYFTITDDGVVSLKPEYRGAAPVANYPYGVSDNGVNIAGSKNSELPEIIVIPSMVNEIAVTALADGMFLNNTVVKSITIPNFIAKISGYFAYTASNLKEINGTENVKVLGRRSFTATALKTANFPNLETIDETSKGIGDQFRYCTYLISVNLGKVTAIPEGVFLCCEMLSCVYNAENVVFVGKDAFGYTRRLKTLPFLSKLTQIGYEAFYDSRVIHDWASLTDCAFGAGATPIQYNGHLADFWSGCTTTPCKTTLRSLFDQKNPLWVNTQVGNTGKTYSTGCAPVCGAMIYSAFENKDLASPVEFEEAVRAINPELMDLDPAYSANLKQWFEAVGYTCVNKPSYNAETLQEMYDALANGALVVACVDDGTIGDGELHAILFYGINDSGELLVVDPISFRGEGFGVYDCVPFTMLFQNIPQDTINAGCLIVSKN